MKVAEVRDLDVDELRQRVKDLDDQLFRLLTVSEKSGKRVVKLRARGDESSEVGPVEPFVSDEDGEAQVDRDLVQPEHVEVVDALCPERLEQLVPAQ